MKWNTRRVWAGIIGLVLVVLLCCAMAFDVNTNHSHLAAIAAIAAGAFAVGQVKQPIDTDPAKLRTVRFKQQYDIYNAGETAGFAPDVADDLVRRGIAVNVDLGSTTASDPPGPGSAESPSGVRTSAEQPGGIIPRDTPPGPGPSDPAGGGGTTKPKKAA